MTMSPSSLPPPTEKDLDFDDPPNYVKDDMQRTFWCLNHKVREILQEYRDQPVYFCYYGGYCTFQSDPNPGLGKAYIDSHFNKNPGHRLSTQDREEWRRMAAERRRMRDDLRRRRAEDDRGWDRRRPSPPGNPYGSDRRRRDSPPRFGDRDSPSNYRDRSRCSPPPRIRERSRESPYRDRSTRESPPYRNRSRESPPGYRGAARYPNSSRSPPRRRSRSRSPFGFGRRPPSPPSGLHREGQRNSWNRLRTPSGSPSPPPPRPWSPRERSGSPKTRRYPHPNNIIDRDGDPSQRHRPVGARSPPPGSRARNSPFSSSSGSWERRRDSPGSSQSRPPPHRGYVFAKDYSHRPGVVGRFNSKKDPKYRDTGEDNRIQEWVCLDRGPRIKGCNRVFHVQKDYSDHITTRRLNGNICPDIKVVKMCRDEGSIRGCGQEFNRLEAYQEHIKVRNKTMNRRCPGLGPEVREEEVKTEQLRPVPLNTGEVMEVDIADSPEYVAPESPASPVPVSPPSAAPRSVTPTSAPPVIASEEISPDRAVSPPPCGPDNPVSVRDDGVILIHPSLPDLVISSNPELSFKKIRLPPRSLENKPPVMEIPPAAEPSKLDVTPVNRTADSDVPSTPLMGTLSSTMIGASPVAKSTPKNLSVASDVMERVQVSNKKDVQVTHPFNDSEADTFSCHHCDQKFSDKQTWRKHEVSPHKHKCDKCPRAFVLLPDLLLHVLEDHDKIESDTFSCLHCDQKFSDKQTWRKHEASPHEHSCTQEECFRMFSDRRQLEIHLSQEHNVTIDHSLGTKGVITTKKSDASNDIAGWAEEWIRSPEAVKRMKNVMKGRTKSRRHELFLEREPCNGSETSRLSNPGYLDGGGEKDTIVFKQLIETVFIKYFDQADSKLQKLGQEIAVGYTSCVLFPETFIHQLEMQGKNREEAELAFMEAAVDLEKSSFKSQMPTESVQQSGQDNAMSDTGYFSCGSSSKPIDGEKEKRKKFKLPSCFADSNERSSPQHQPGKVSAKRKSQEDEMEMLLDKKKRSQMLKKIPELPSLKTPEVVTVNTSASRDNSQESGDNSAQKSEEILTNKPTKLSFGAPSSHEGAKSSNKVMQKSTVTSDLLKQNTSKVSKSLEKTKIDSGKCKEVNLMSKKTKVKTSKKSESVKSKSKESSEGKFKKSQKVPKDRSEVTGLFEIDETKKPTKPQKAFGNQLKHVHEIEKDQEYEEASLDDLLAGDDEPEKEKQNKKDVTNDSVEDRLEALFKSPGLKSSLLSLDDIADDPNLDPSDNDSVDQLISDNEAPEVDNHNDKDVTNIDVGERLEGMSKSPHKSVGSSSRGDIADDQALDPYQLSEASKKEIESSKDTDSRSVASKDQKDHPSTSESTTTLDKVVVQFSGEEAPEIVSMDTDDHDVDSSYEPSLVLSPNTSVCHLVNRIMDKESEVLFSRDETNISSEVEESFEKGDMNPSHTNVELDLSDRETGVNNVSDRSQDTLPLPTPVHYRTLREALKDSDAETEPETEPEDEEEEDSIELVHGKDAIDSCPNCQAALSMVQGQISINISDFSYIVTCSDCCKRITIRNMISEKQKALLLFN